MILMQNKQHSMSYGRKKGKETNPPVSASNSLLSIPEAADGFLSRTKTALFLDSDIYELNKPNESCKPIIVYLKSVST